MLNFISCVQRRLLSVGGCGLLLVCMVPGITDAVEEALNRETVVVLGDSIAAGSGVDLSEAFPAKLQEKIDELRLPYEVVNAGVSGDTTASGARRVKWLLRRKIDVLVIELGGNDALRGVPTSETKKNIEEMIDIARATYPEIEVVLCGMQIYGDWGADYAEAFKQLFLDVAGEKEAVLVPFLLEGVGGLEEFNQSDKIHPNPRGHARVADNVWTVLQPVLSARSESREVRSGE